MTRSRASAKAAGTRFERVIADALDQHIGQLGVTDRRTRHDEMSSYLGRQVASSNDLSADEAKMLIDWLERRTQDAGVGR